MFECGSAMPSLNNKIAICTEVKLIFTTKLSWLFLFYLHVRLCVQITGGGGGGGGVIQKN